MHVPWPSCSVYMSENDREEKVVVESLGGSAFARKFLIEQLLSEEGMRLAEQDGTRVQANDID